MQLEKDEFVLTYDPSEIAIADMLAVCKASGFPATVMPAASIPETALPEAAVLENQPQPEQERPSQFDTETWPEFLRHSLTIAKTQHKPLVLEFGAGWCAPCKRMERETWPDPAVQSLLSGTVFLRIDTDEHPELAKIFGVLGIPDTRFLSSDGQELRKLLGFQDARQITKELNNLFEKLSQSKQQKHSTSQNELGDPK